MTREQGEQLQKECKEIAKPYIELLSDIHNCSTMRMIFSPENPSMLPSIQFPDEEAREIMENMKREVILHVIKRMDEFGH